MHASPLLTVIGFMTMTLGVTFGLYALLTRGQRRVTREIRAGGVAQGWRYRRRWWQGNPTAFRIDGRSAGGIDWILTSSDSGTNESRWSAEHISDGYINSRAVWPAGCAIGKKLQWLHATESFVLKLPPLSVLRCSRLNTISIWFSQLAEVGVK
jgi:hypothetical protein